MGDTMTTTHARLLREALEFTLRALVTATENSGNVDTGNFAEMEDARDLIAEIDSENKGSSR